MTLCKIFIHLFVLLGSFHFLSASHFILGTKQIHVAGYPDAFNPSIVRWQGKLLMSFRNITNPKDSYNCSEIGLIWLDDQFNPISAPQILDLYDGRTQGPKRAEDARLITIDDRLYMIYSDNEDPLITKDRFRVYVAEVKIDNHLFYLASKDRLEDYEGNKSGAREKNWTPFIYHDNLLLSYSLNPHLVFRPLLGSSTCETVSRSKKPVDWSWGELRGGTQSLWVDGCYLTFFHSCVRMMSHCSDGREMLHYFMGACTFEGEPPFEMTYISPEPIIGNDFFSGPYYKPYWGSWRGVFPGGFVFDDEFIYIVYGKQNHELWVVLLDKKGLFKSLIPIPR